MNELATLEWTMTVVEASKMLRIDYNVTSRASQRFYLCDLLPMPGAKTWVLGSKEIIVMNGPEPGSVIFSRARVPSRSPLPFLVDPGARSIDPGQTVRGSAEVPLPLTARHYRGTLEPLKGKPKTATLQIGCIVGNAHWSELLLDDGGKLTIPNSSDPMQLLCSESKPLPI